VYTVYSVTYENGTGEQSEVAEELRLGLVDGEPSPLLLQGDGGAAGAAGGAAGGALPRQQQHHPGPGSGSGSVRPEEGGGGARLEPLSRRVVRLVGHGLIKKKNTNKIK